MADARIVFPNNKIVKSIGSIEIDAFAEEEHGKSASITRYPIEDKSTISDHIVLDPETINIRGIVGTFSLTGANGSSNRVRDAYGKIINLMEEKTLISIVTGLRVYSDMFISNFTVPRTAQNGGALNFSMSLQHAVIVSSQVAQIPKTQITPEEPQAQGKADIGKANSGQTQTKTEDNENYLAQIEAEVEAALDKVGITAQ